MKYKKMLIIFFLIFLIYVILFFVKTEKKENGVVSLNFDDATIDQYNLAYPLMKEIGLNATIFVISNLSLNKDSFNKTFGNYNVMGLRELKEVYENNWEIGSHSLSHKRLSLLNNSEIEYELVESKKQLLRNGFNVTSLAVPFGNYNPEVIEYSEKNYNILRLNAMGFNDLTNPNFSNLKSLWISKSISSEEVCSWINFAQDNSLWIVLVFHKFKQIEEEQFDESEEDFKKILKCIVDSKIEVKTFNEMYLKMQTN